MGRADLDRAGKMLRVAVPNTGTLAEPASEMLVEAGYRQRHDPKDLTVIDPLNEVEFFFLRPRDISVYVGSGELDLGITGRALTLDSEAPVSELLALGFGGSSFRDAAPLGRPDEPDPVVQRHPGAGHRRGPHPARGNRRRRHRQPGRRGGVAAGTLPVA